MANGEDFISDYVADQHPEIDVRPGTGVRDLLITPHAGLVERLIQDIEQVRNEFDLTQAASMDPEILDKRGSNWFVTRKEGKKAAGFVRIVLDSQQDFNIREGHRFLYGPSSLVFLMSEARSISRSDLSEGPGEDEWFADVNLIAIEDGDQFNIPPGEFVTFDPIITAIKRVESVETFSQGVTKESNLEYFSRLKEAITVRNLINATSINTVLKNEENLFVEDVYVAGFGAPEQWRDFIAGDLGSMHIGNKTDVYVKQRLQVKTKTFTVLAGGVVRFAAEDIPVYRITMFQDAQTTIPPLQFSTDYLVRFSKREEPFIQTSLPEGDTVSITFESMDIDSADIFVGQSDNRVLLADLLIRSLAPIYMTVALQYTLADGTLPIDEQIGIDLITEYIHGLPIGTAPEASDIDSLLRNQFSSIERVVMPITMEGTLHTFTGQKVQVSSTDVLNIIEDTPNSLSRKTVIYIPENITLGLA